MCRREPWPLGQKGDTRALGGSLAYPPFSIHLGVPNMGVSGPLCSGPTGHIVLPCMEDSGPPSSGPRPPPWLFASEPRLEGPGETESRVGYPRRGAKEQNESEPRAGHDIHLVIIALKMMADKDGTLAACQALRQAFYMD